MPSGLSDGALIVDTGLNNAGFFRDARQFKAAANSLKNTVNRVWQDMGRGGNAYLQAIQRSAKANREFISELQRMEAEAKRLKAAMDDIGNAKLKTDAYQRNREEAKKLNNVWSRLEEKRDQALLMDDAKGVSKYEIQIEQIMDRLRALNKERDRLEANGQAFVAGRDTETYRDLAARYEQVTARIAEMRRAAEEAGGPMDVLGRNVASALATLGRSVGSGVVGFLRKLAAGAKNAAVQLAKLAGRAVVSGLRKIGQLAGGAAKKLFGLGKSARQSGGGFQFSLKNLLKYGLGIRSLFVLFNRLRSAIKEGFETLSSYDPRLRASLASLKGALGGLKGSLASAFAPILTAIAPALTTLINLLTQAVNAIGMFFAAITGQSYYAAKGVAAVGNAASGSSGSVKELKRQLAGFDELNILSAGSSGGGGGGGGSASGITYEKTPIGEGIANFAAQMKALVEAEDWDGLGRLFAEKINGAFDKARTLISWSNLGAKITQAVTAATGTINGLLDGVRWKDIGATFGEGLNTITNTLLLWYKGINWRGVGEAIANSLNGLIKTVNWDNLGALIREKAHSLIKILRGAFETFEWGNAGESFAKAVNSLFADENTWKDAGAAIDRALNGALDFAGKFLGKLDAKQMAIDIKAALAEIKWGEIWDSFTENARAAFGLAEDFLRELLTPTDPAQKYMRQRPAGMEKNANKSLGELIGSGLSDAVKNGLDAIKSFLDNDIPWAEWGVQLGDMLRSVDWVGVANKLWDAIIATADGVGKTLVAAIFGPDSKVYKYLFPEEPGKMSFIEKATTIEGWKEIGKDVYNAITGNGSWSKQTKKAALGNVDNAYNSIWNASDAIQRAADYFFGGGNAYDEDPMMLLRAEKWYKDNAKAQEANTKATKENTNVTEQTGQEYTDQKRFEWAKGGGDLAGWDALFGGETPEVNASVNFIPQGGGTRFENNLGGFLKSVFSPGTDTEARVSLIRQGFSTVAAWLTGSYMGDPVSKGVGVARSGFSTVAAWLTGSYMGGAVDKGVGVARSGFSNVAAWLLSLYMGGAVDKGVGVARSGFSTVASWLTGSLMGGAVNKAIGLAKSGWSTVADFVKGSMGGTIKANIDLVVGKVTGTVDAIVKAIKGKALGGVITAGGRDRAFAAGGVIRGGSARWWSAVPKYAAGTRNARGTLFMAGEAGPEIMGHINGRTEILNQSQLAQTMRAATYGGMIQALQGVRFTMPAMATGGVMPYEVSAQIARSAADIQNTLDANHEDLVQTIIDVAGQIAAIIQRMERKNNNGAYASGLTAQQVIDEINRRTQMFSASPLKGV